MMNPRQMILFGIEFMQMMEDFTGVDDLCPACEQNSRSNLICLRDECDFVLFVELGDAIHPAFYTWTQKKMKELKKE